MLLGLLLFQFLGTGFLLLLVGLLKSKSFFKNVFFLINVIVMGYWWIVFVYCGSDDVYVLLKCFVDLFVCEFKVMVLALHGCDFRLCFCYSVNGCCIWVIDVIV